MEKNIKRFVYAATSSAYGNSETLPKYEEMAPNPISPYSIQKLTGENYLKVYHQIFGMETVALRYFNVFGKRQSAQSEYAAVIPNFIQRMLYGKPPIIFGDGSQSRDFTYVENVAHSLWLAATVPGIDGGIYNITNGEPMAFEALLRMFLEAVALKPRFITLDYRIISRIVAAVEWIWTHLHFKSEPVFTRYTLMTLAFSQSMNIDRAREELGYEPLITIEEGIKIYGEWYRKHH